MEKQEKNTENIVSNNEINRTIRYESVIRGIISPPPPQPDDDMYYCGPCGHYVPIAQFPHPHTGGR